MSISSPVAVEVLAGDRVSTTELSSEHKTAPSTIFRWIQRGLPDGCGGRIFLEAFRRGKIWLTSRAAVARFFERLPQSQGASAPTAPRTPSKRDRDSGRAQKALQEVYGI
jgi:hypothetical protein